MKKFLLSCLFFAGLFWALSTYQGLAVQGEYDSMVLNFRESLSPAQVDRELKTIAAKYGIEPKFNSAFSKSDLSTGQKFNGVKKGLGIEVKVKNDITEEIKTKTKNAFR